MRKTFWCATLATLSGAMLPLVAQATVDGGLDAGTVKAVWWLMGILATLFCSTILAGARLVTMKLGNLEKMMTDIRVDAAKQDGRYEAIERRVGALERKHEHE